MEQKIVTSQAELDAIPVDYNGRIIIQFGTPYDRAIVNRKFKYSVVACGNSSVEAWENSSVEAWGNSSVVARENSSVEACGNSSVVACGNSSVEAWENSSVEAWGNSSVVAWDNSSVEACGNSSVEAWENSSVEACGNSSVVARENSSVEACGNSSVVAGENSSVVARENSSVEAWGNSSVEAWGNSSVVACGNSSVVAGENSSVVAGGNAQITDRTLDHQIKTGGNARIVYDPRTIEEYADTYDLEIIDGKIKLYKAVHKSDTGEYRSDRERSFLYPLGQTVKADALTINPEIDCGHGIHMAHKTWCVSYGSNWKDLAILELEVDAAGVVVPLYGTGKVRAAEAKVLREVPLEECGLLGKLLAKEH